MEQEQENIEVAVSEQTDVQPQETVQEEAKMVPLAALEAERRKRQDAEAKSQLYQEYLQREREGKEKEPEEDPTSLVEKQHLDQHTSMTKREILEQVYQDMNPEAVRKVEKYLPKILEQKPWIADVVNSAQNRYARASEIVNDYLHLVEEKPPAKPVEKNNDGARIVQNAQKPRSPVEIGKSQNPGSKEYLKSIQGKKEFREYRQKLLRG